MLCERIIWPKESIDTENNKGPRIASWGTLQDGAGDEEKIR